MRHLTQKVVGKGLEVVSKVVPENKRHEFDQKVEDAHRRGFLSDSALEELRKVAEVKEEADPFPDLSRWPVETVEKRWFSWDEKKWEKETLKVRIAGEKFAEGGMREAFFMAIVHPDGKEERMVAKRQKEGAQSSEAYDTDVVMQAACQAVAKAFNARNPVKPVHFVDCFVIRRTSGQWWGVETYLKGKYIKYNNNYGYVGKDARNTPQAFTHFSYEFTEGKLMIVDIQGVGDMYTDPQVHTADGKGFGMGNLGPVGMDRFMRTHWCNSICTSFGLQFHAPKKFGVAWHKAPKRDGTHVSGTAGEATSMRMADFIGDLQPKKGSATPEELALLGMNEKQYSALAAAFNELDKDKSGFLDKDELYHVFQKARVADSKSKEAEEFMNFLSRIETKVNSDGKVNFKDFVLCWTDNL